jgi:ATP-dependent RNA helicase SUPV3L1/SUV3
MQNTEARQLKLTDDGRILFQTDPTNPLPGDPVARVKKGAALLEPEIEALIPGIEGAGMTMLGVWLKQHIFTVLESLMPLASELDPEGPARDICRKLHDSLGIILRSDLEAEIAKLDETGRALLRQKKVRMGPVLVFLPALNKPAAVRLRALLWSLWHDKELPAPVPHDGATSVIVEIGDPVYYRAIGYPLYGRRAIRVDMLDRVIGAIYDGAKDGKFQAQHRMAEWLGCPIPDLYEVLEAMGHKKIHDPANDPKPPEGEAPVAPSETVAEVKAEEAKPEEVKSEEPKAEEVKTEEAKTEEAAKPAAPVRPALATFQLRRNRPARKPPPFEKLEKKVPPPFEKLDRPPRQFGKKDDKPRGDRKPRGKDRDRNRDDRPERVISAKAQVRAEDSPFAALQGLKVKAKDGQG